MLYDDDEMMMMFRSAGDIISFPGVVTGGCREEVLDADAIFTLAR